MNKQEYKEEKSLIYDLLLCNKRYQEVGGGGLCWSYKLIGT